MSHGNGVSEQAPRGGGIFVSRSASAPVGNTAWDLHPHAPALPGGSPHHVPTGTGLRACRHQEARACGHESFATAGSRTRASRGSALKAETRRVMGWGQVEGRPRAVAPAWDSTIARRDPVRCVLLRSPLRCPCCPVDGRASPATRKGSKIRLCFRGTCPIPSQKGLLESCLHGPGMGGLNGLLSSGLRRLQGHANILPSSARALCFRGPSPHRRPGSHRPGQPRRESLSLLPGELAHR